MAVWIRNQFVIRSAAKLGTRGRNKKGGQGQEVGNLDSESIRYSITENTNQYRKTTNKQRLLEANFGSSTKGEIYEQEDNNSASKGKREISS